MTISQLKEHALTDHGESLTLPKLRAATQAAQKPLRLGSDSELAPLTPEVDGKSSICTVDWAFDRQSFCFVIHWTNAVLLKRERLTPNFSIRTNEGLIDLVCGATGLDRDVCHTNIIAGQTLTNELKLLSRASFEITEYI